MPLETTTLLTSALTDLESARDYLKLNDDSRDQVVTTLINAATGILERRTRRNLKSRTYTDFAVDGTGHSWLWFPEYPVTTLTAAKALNQDGTAGYTSLVVTGAQILHGRKLVLPLDTFWLGTGNIAITCVAGYLAGTHDADLAALEQACKRVVQIMYQDWNDQVGRGTAISVAGMSVQFIDAPLPKDVQAVIADYARIV